MESVQNAHVIKCSHGTKTTVKWLRMSHNGEISTYLHTQDTEIKTDHMNGVSLARVSKECGATCRKSYTGEMQQTNIKGNKMKPP